MNPAQSTRLEKERKPGRFCGNPRCLWRVKHLDKPDTPCPKHMKATTAPPALTDVTVVTADRNYSGSDTSKITDAREG